MQRLEVTCAVLHICMYIYMYVVRGQMVNECLPVVISTYISQMITNIVYGYFIMFQCKVANTAHVIIIYNTGNVT